MLPKQQSAAQGFNKALIYKAFYYWSLCRDALIFTELPLLPSS